MEALASTLRRLAEAERRYASELRGLAASLRYMRPLAAIVEAIARDSEKHAELYEALIPIAVGESQPRLAESDLREVEKVIDAHIQTEVRMIEETRRLLGEVAEPRIKLIVAAIHEDEVRHHKLLLDIRDKVSRARVLTDEEFWDAVWRDSPFHGAPGG